MRAVKHFNMKNLVTILTFLISSTFAFGEGGLTRLIEIEGEVSQSSTNIELHLTLINRSSRDLLIPSGGLPWNRYALTLVVAETSPSSPTLQQEPDIADYRGAGTKLKGKASLKGMINLTYRFPELLTTLRRVDVIVFWSYQPAPEGQTQLERVSGSILIPKLPTSK